MKDIRPIEMADKRSSCAWWRVLALWILLSVWSVSAEEPKSFSPYQVKAVYVFNFTKFVYWPEDVVAPTNAPFVIGIVGEDPFGAALDDVVHGESVHKRAIVIQRFRSDETITNCQILFIAQSEQARLQDVLEQVKGRVMLTVADMPQAADHGVMINLPVVQGSVKMEINQKAAESARLQVSGKLLSLAKIVSSETDKQPSKP